MEKEGQTSRAGWRDWNNTSKPLFLTREGEHDTQMMPTTSNVTPVTGS